MALSLKLKQTTNFSREVINQNIYSDLNLTKGGNRYLFYQTQNVKKAY